MLGEMWSFKGRYKVLHMTWFAFFLSFVVWFNLPPLATTIKAEFGLGPGQMGTLAMCNVALTVPARINVPFARSFPFPCHALPATLPPNGSWIF